MITEKRKMTKQERQKRVLLKLMFELYELVSKFVYFGLRNGLWLRRVMHEWLYYCVVCM